MLIVVNTSTVLTRKTERFHNLWLPSLAIIYNDNDTSTILRIYIQVQTDGEWSREIQVKCKNGKGKIYKCNKATYNPKKRVGIKQHTKERKNMDKAIYAVVQSCIVICTDKSNIYAINPVKMG